MFDNVQVRRIRIAQESKLKLDESIFYISGASQ
jgi:hypothetical protein